MGRRYPPSSLLYAIVGYPTVLGACYRAQTGERLEKWARAFKAVSTVHSVLCTALVARDVFDVKWKDRNLIFELDEDSNARVALELGYLLQDTVALLLVRKYTGFRVPQRTLLHHVIYTALLGLFFEFASRRAEKGVFFIESFLLMNASTPLLNLKWFLRQGIGKGEARHRLMVQVLNITLPLVYGSSRIGLLVYMMWVYGQRKGLSTVAAFRSVASPIQVATTDVC